eukprot:755656-Hanusia_phi.AAC.4
MIEKLDKGTCSCIPQSTDEEKLELERSRLVTLPVEFRDGIIWCWTARLMGMEAEADHSKLNAMLLDRIGTPGVRE